MTMMMPMAQRERETDEDRQAGGEGNHPVNVQWDNPRTKKIIPQTNGCTWRISSTARGETDQAIIMRRVPDSPLMRKVSRMRRRERRKKQDDDSFHLEAMVM
jgi:hypothetical protein